MTATATAKTNYPAVILRAVRFGELSFVPAKTTTPQNAVSQKSYMASDEYRQYGRWRSDLPDMTSDDITREQARALKNKLQPMLGYLIKQFLSIDRFHICRREGGDND